MNKKLNVRFLVGLLVCSLAVVAASWLIYTIQAQRVTRVLLDLAEESERQGQLERATTYLTRYIRCRPGDQDALLRHATIMEKQATSKEAQLQVLAVLDRLLASQPQRDDVRKRFVRLAMANGEWRAALPHLRVLEKADPDNGELENWLGQCESAHQHSDEAIDWYQKAITHGPQPLASYLHLAELMKFRAAPEEEIGTVMNALVAAHGQSPRAYLARGRYHQGLKALAEAAADSAMARKLAPRDFDVLLTDAEVSLAKGQRQEAKSALEQCLQMRPDQARLYGLLALVEIQSGDRAEATACLRRGLQATVPADHPMLLPILADLLLQDGKLPEAAAAVAALRKAKTPTAVVDFLDARLMVQQRRWDAASELVRDLPDLLATAADRNLALHLQKTAEAPEDYRNHLALAVQLWTTKGHSYEVGAAFHQAVRAGDYAVDALQSYVQYLVLAGQKAQADELIQEAGAKLSPERAGPLLAQCYELIGRLDQAQAQYDSALALKVAVPSLARAGADFHLRRNEFAKAERHLRLLLDPKVKAAAEDVVWARRNLAVGLALSGQHSKLQEANDLLQLNAAAAPRPSVEDERARAVVLSKQPYARAKAIGLLEDLMERQSLCAEEIFLLVQLHDADRNWVKERKCLESLLAVPQGKTPAMLAFAVQVLTTHGELPKAQALLAELKRQEPETLRTVALEALLCKTAGKAGAAVELLQAFAARKDADLGGVASVLEDLGQIAAADAMFSRFTAESKHPEALLARARFLGRQKRLAKALDLCDQAATTVSIERVAQDYVALLHLTEATSQHHQRVQRRLKDELVKAPQSVPLLLALAQVPDQRHNAEEMAAHYRQVLAIDAGNVVALNNLAWLLALDGDRDGEALTLINRAITRHGAAPQLLDTRALVYLGKRQGRLALDDLQQAAATAPTGACYFHKAQAHMALGQRKLAEAALEKAHALRLTVGSLHPLERPAYQELLRDLAQ